MTDFLFDALLCDMDGLLVDTEPLWMETETEIMARMGASWAPADQHALLGGNMTSSVAYMLSRATRPAEPEAVARWMLDGMLARAAAGRVIVRPGARELLSAAGARGLPHALVTSSKREFAQAVLASTGFRFTVVVTGDDVAAHKPDPEPYLLAARLLGASPSRCVALEDSPSGVASAGAAGCLVVAVPSLVPVAAAPPWRVVVDSLAEVNLQMLGVLAARAGMSG